jgi:hypothetical protein
MPRTGVILAFFGLVIWTLSGIAVGQLQEQSVEEAVHLFVDQTIEYLKTQQGAKLAGQYAPDLTATKDGRWIPDTHAYVTEFGEAVSEIRVHEFVWMQTLLLKERDGKWKIVHEHTSHHWHESAAEQ